MILPESRPDFAADPADSGRLISLDAMRGFAVIAILWVNMLSFGMPDAAFLSPYYSVPAGAADERIWQISFLFADGKFRGLFTLLFGASMMLVMDRAERSGASPAAIHATRMIWLMLIGAAHYLLLWHGDILLVYALAGLLLTGVRGQNSQTLMAWGISILLAGAIWLVWLGAGRIEGLAHALGAVSDGAAMESVRQLHQADLANNIASVSADLHLFGGSYAEIVAGRVDKFLAGLLSLPVAAVETVPMMLIGMALYRSGFLSGEWAPSAYRRLIGWCLPSGLLLTALAGACAAASGYDPMVGLTAHLGLSVPGRLLMILAYAAILILLITRFPASGWTRRLAAAGRMALSNYLGCSLIMTSLFYGYGAGFYGAVGRLGLYGFAAIGTVMMLIWSPWWMGRHAYGPAEWMWRSLARGEWQRLRA